MIDTQFAVVDVETTGLFPHRHDRIVEVAIFRVDWQGQILDEYVTLINPERDIGPTSIHGIRACDVLDAPPFSAVVGDIVFRLRGALFVAHNAMFDLGFLRAEFNRASVCFPAPVTLCTMELSRLVDPHVPGRSLGCLCEHFRIPLRDAHEAGADAKATVSLLAACLSRIGPPFDRVLDHFGIPHDGLPAQDWSDVKPSGQCCRRQRHRPKQQQEPGFLAKLVLRLPSVVDATPETNAYLRLLDDAISDREMSPAEADALIQYAAELGMTIEHVLHVHKCYFTELVRVALQDGKLTRTEKQELHIVQRLLCISESQASQIIAELTCDNEVVAQESADASEKFPGLSGKAVCFTGEFMGTGEATFVSREVVQAIAERCGLKVRNGVTKKLDILVAADPASMSTKARKARQYGIPIMSESEFWLLLGGFDNAMRIAKLAGSLPGLS